MSKDTVPVETVGEGDIVAFAWTDGDVKRVVTGKVANVERWGRTRIFKSEQGIELARYDMDHPRRTLAVMVERYRPVDPSLFEYHDTDSMRVARGRASA